MKAQFSMGVSMCICAHVCVRLFNVNIFFQISRSLNKLKYNFAYNKEFRDFRKYNLAFICIFIVS